jgi:hypothetical protein
MYRYRVIIQWFTDVVMTLLFKVIIYLFPRSHYERLQPYASPEAGGQFVCVFPRRRRQKWNDMIFVKCFERDYKSFSHVFLMIFWYFIFSIEGHTVHILFQPLSSCLTSFYSAQVLGVPLESIYLKSSELDSGTWWTMGFPIGWKLGKSTFWKRHGNA